MKLKKLLNDPPKDYYSRLAQVESNNNPLAKARTSSAAGLYQFTKGTWNEITSELGLNYTLDDRFDPEKSKKVVEEFTRRNERTLQNKLGRKPNDAELYLAHFYGAGGATKLLSTIENNPNASVTDFVSSATLKANKNVFFNKNGSPKKAFEIYNWSAKKFNSPVIGEEEDLVQTEIIEETEEDKKAKALLAKTPGSKIPSLATTPINPNYAALPEAEKQKQEVAKEAGISEAQVRKLLEQEREATESRFLSAFQQQNAQEQPSYTPQSQQEDLSHLYNYIDIDNYADGGKHTAKKGDSLSKIAKDNNLSLNEILELNEAYKANPDLLQIGDTINLGKQQQEVVPSPEVRRRLNFSDIDKSKIQLRERPFERVAESTGVRRKFDPAKKLAPAKSESSQLDFNNLIETDDIKRVQKMLYYSGYDIGTSKERAIDGKLGPKTKAALESYKTKLAEKSKPKEKNIIDKTQNLVPLSARQFLYDTLGGEGELNETSLNNSDYDALKEVVVKNINRDKLKVDYDDWREARGSSDDTRTDDMNLLNPYSNLQKTLGQASISIDDSGDIYVKDTYNFNDAGGKENRYKNKFTDDEGLLPISSENSTSNNIYRIARNFKTKYGRKEGGSPVNIYIGNVSEIF